MKTPTLIGLALAVALIAGAVQAQPYVVLADGRRVDGSAIRALSNGDINLTTAAGVRTFPRGSYARAVAAEPPEYRQAQAALQAQRYDDAVRLLEGIATRFRYLDWDVQALKLLPEALIQKGDSEEAVKAYDRLFQIAPDQRQDSAVAWGQRRAMLAAKQYSVLERQLDAVAASGSRPDAARAQIMRGDIRAAQNNLDLAVLDYLRTVILFQDVRDADIQGEAHFKAAQTLEALRDPRARDIYKRLVDNHASSPYAAQARGKL